MKIKSIILCALTSCFFGLLPVSAIHAEQDSTLSFSPIIIIDSTKAKGSKNNLMMQRQYTNDTDHFSTGNLNQDNKLLPGDLDDYALALGATFHINDFLNVGAACGMPLTNEEPIQVDDLSIEAMVTMQF